MKGTFRILPTGAMIGAEFEPGTCKSTREEARKAWHGVGIYFNSFQAIRVLEVRVTVFFTSKKH
jgi:hypothetical protein